MNPTRLTGPICAAAALLDAVLAVAVATTGLDFALDYLVRAVLDLGLLAGLVGLALSGAAAGPLFRTGTGVALLAMVALLVAELTEPGLPAMSGTLFMVAPPLIALGLVLAGIAVLRGTGWRGWSRGTPLLLGVWVPAVLLPAIAVGGPPPAAAAVWAIAGWDACWLLLGLAVMSQAGRPAAVVTA